MSISNFSLTDRAAFCLATNPSCRVWRLHRLLLMLLVYGVGLCCFSAGNAMAQTETESSTATMASIESVLTEQVKAWNEGDLEKFMQTYWKSDKLTFSSGGKTTYGWQATLDNYKKSYATPNKMGQLHFDGLKISMIESKSALVLGNWHLRMNDGQKRDGNFSLVVKRLESGWKIIHDHSSALDPVPETEMKK